ncbi:hypothetical protein A1Q2_03378 [Trichosporon asahii var. asahii CBS 8904]|uniref:Uncharacterized protein n=2 Tax=Trichosporon asahii var. asahii TaxID=189963 RepID=K1VS25_TRIAC|nr:hypothetical protein A1Q1_00116 [Trichosporon asahii var. asahii CBS 2479]EJT53109.1 hypothetical protein A1Q1_00116 [Trichosporon asahii var. asahii CBS 2479]EKD02322.1 hypothetical protein A1Q2_03378 [Trichosporon asahii var. asahii CBS 8904]
MAPRIRLGYNAKPWHDLRDIKAYNEEFFSPEFQSHYPDMLYLCSFTPEGQWIYRDCKKEDEWVIYAAATPPYNEVMCEKIVRDDYEEPRGCTADTAYFEADHHFEPVENAKEIRESLPPDATLQDAMQALWRTCKGCAKYVKDGNSSADKDSSSAVAKDAASNPKTNHTPSSK